jgi:hypothetical protein
MLDTYPQLTQTNEKTALLKQLILKIDIWLTKHDNSIPGTSKSAQAKERARKKQQEALFKLRALVTRELFEVTQNAEETWQATVSGPLAVGGQKLGEQWATANESARANLKGSIFRGNTDLAGQAIKAYTQAVGAGYLEDQVTPLLDHLIETLGQNLPGPEEEPLTPEQADQLLVQLYDTFLQGLFLSQDAVDNVPKAVCQNGAAVFDTVYQAINDIGAAYSSLVDVVILRYISPAIVNKASTLGAGQSQKMMVALSSMLQSQANRQLFKAENKQALNEILTLRKNDFASFMIGVYEKGGGGQGVQLVRHLSQQD